MITRLDFVKLFKPVGKFLLSSLVLIAVAQCQPLVARLFGDSNVGRAK